MTYLAAELKGQDAQINALRPDTRKTRGKSSLLLAGARLIGSTEYAAAPRALAVVAESVSSLAQYHSEWESLAEGALEANVFYEPWMLMPAIQAYGTASKLQFVLVFVTSQAEPGGRPVLSGFFPIEKRRCYKPVPATIYSLWKHPHCYLCTPLIKAEYARASLLAFLDWLTSEAACGAFEFNYVPADGPFRDLLAECLTQRGLASCIIEDFERAFIRTADNVEQYLQQAISGKGRQELRRKVSRLSEMGALKYEELGADEDANAEDANAWIEDFLQVEATGWKGTERTARACNKRDRDFFRLIASAAFERQRLMIGALRLNNKTIAIQCGFFSGSGYFAFKSAFDESYGHFSPGVLLLVEVISSVHRTDGVLWMDSCTSPDNFVANRLFAGRRGIQAILVAAGRSGAILISVMRALRRMKHVRRPELIGKPHSTPVLENEVSA